MRQNRNGPDGPEPGDDRPGLNPENFALHLNEFQRNAGSFPWGGIGIAALLLLLFIVFSRSFIVVQAGERAVIFNKLTGMRPGQLSEGLHFNVPILWLPTKYDVKSLTYTMSGAAGENGEESHRPEAGTGQVPDDALQALTSDGLPVGIDLSVRFHIDPDNVWKLHQEIGPEFIDKVVRPQTRSIARTAVAEFTVLDVYSGNRQQIIEIVQRELSKGLMKNYIILDEVLLRDVRFPKEFQDAIEQKQVALQQAEQMKYEVDRARSEKQQRIIEAEGEAAAIRAKAQALAQNPQLVQYEYVKRLPANTKIMVTDSNTIINLGDFLDSSRSKAADAGGDQ